MEIFQLEDQNVKKNHVSKDLALVWTEHPLEDLETDEKTTTPQNTHNEISKAININ
ncbi:MAG TPA: hypothetical protein VMT26_05420 [Candidatus Bathyarchaeia archaeon]|jgi:hypothetical protein|nr:hypothetical protein [Candidatus Bathyarchaeia archaeon]